jgi:hypothetical protein
LDGDYGVRSELVLEPGRHGWSYWSRTVEDTIVWAVRALGERAASERAASRGGERHAAGGRR